MNEEPIIPNWITRTLLFGIAFFIIGLIIDDIYTVVAGLSLIIIYTISATGEKIIHHMDRPPKGL